MAQLIKVLTSKPVNWVDSSRPAKWEGTTSDFHVHVVACTCNPTDK